MEAIEAVCVFGVFVGAMLNEDFHNVNVSFPGCVVQSVELVLLGFYVDPDKEFFGS